MTEPLLETLLLSVEENKLCCEVGGRALMCKEFMHIALKRSEKGDDLRALFHLSFVAH
jgi:hypothetical protein